MYTWKWYRNSKFYSLKHQVDVTMHNSIKIRGPRADLNVLQRCGLLCKVCSKMCAKKKSTDKGSEREKETFDQEATDEKEYYTRNSLEWEWKVVESYLKNSTAYDQQMNTRRWFNFQKSCHFPMHCIRNSLQCDIVDVVTNFDLPVVKCECEHTKFGTYVEIVCAWNENLIYSKYVEAHLG